VRILGAPGEFLDQGRLAAAGFAGDKYHPALASQCRVQKPVQLRQFALSGDEDRPFDFNRFSF
jgi:hypothetical protein